MIYTLQPTNTVFDMDTQFPELTPNKYVGILLSGGMESSLVTLLAQMKYGKENVLCFYNDAIFSSNKPEVNDRIRANIKRAEDNLGVTITYLESNYEYHISNRTDSVTQGFVKMQELYNLEYLFWGVTKLFFEVEPFRQPNLSRADVHHIIGNDMEKYHSTYEEFHIATDMYTDLLLQIDIPAEVYPLLRNNTGFLRAPFDIINKSEVVDFYRQLGLLDILAKTTSCISNEMFLTGKHCGQCFNCQQRSDSFDILGSVTDKTEYLTDVVIQRRQALLEKIK